MVLVGVALVVFGALAVVSAVFGTDINDGVIEFLGIDVSPMTLFLIGLGSGLSIMWGLSVMKFGTKRGLARRKENKRLSELSEKLGKVEAERRADGDLDDSDS
jgi:predicted RND superfamily exporter protein